MTDHGEAAIAKRGLLTTRLPGARRMRDILKLALYCAAFACALQGNIIWQFDKDFHGGEGWLWLACALWLLAEIVGDWHAIRAWWRERDKLDQSRWLARILPVGIAISGGLLLLETMTAELHAVGALLSSALARFALAGAAWLALEFAWRRLRQKGAHDQPVAAPQASSAAEAPASRRDALKQLLPPRAILLTRLCLLPLAIAASMQLWQRTSGNRIELSTIALWLASAGLWAFALAPAAWLDRHSLREGMDKLRGYRPGGRKRVLLAFGAVMLLAASFRLTDLYGLPREMMFHQLDPLLAAHGILSGDYYPVHIPIGAGREAVHAYMVAAFSTLPGQGLDHMSLKRLAALISLLCIPAMYWFGVESMREEGRRTRILTGLLLAGFVAASYWHVSTSREAVRQLLTPLVSPLILIYLWRAMRGNRRGDFIKAGLLLGFSLYFYKALRIMPLAVVAGLVVALYLRHRSWRSGSLLSLNLGILAFIAFMVYLPLHHVSLESPEMFWKQEQYYMSGEGVSLSEQSGRFLELLSILMSNIRDALRMFNWAGAQHWTHNVPGQPSLDIYVGALLILGLAAWLSRAVKTRDPVWLFLPLAILICLLPSALALTRAFENPHSARALNALAPIYLLAALPLVRFVQHLRRVFPRWPGILLALGVCAALLLLSNQQNSQTYFEAFRQVHYKHNPPLSDAADYLRRFAESDDGAYGNAFIIAYPHWWDHRVVAIDAGQWNWQYRHNVDLQNLPGAIRRAWQGAVEYPLDADRDMLFFFSPLDTFAPQQLQEWFPPGRAQLRQSYMPAEVGHSRYYVYRVPAPGREGLDAFLAAYG